MEFLASHTTAGGNSNKANLDLEIVHGVIDYVPHTWLLLL